jgi:hypothetical protein
MKTKQKRATKEFKKLVKAGLSQIEYSQKKEELRKKGKLYE